MIEASISTVPAVGEDRAAAGVEARDGPRATRTAASTASSARPPRPRTRQPACDGRPHAVAELLGLLGRVRARAAVDDERRARGLVIPAIRALEPWAHRDHRSVGMARMRSCAGRAGDAASSGAALPAPRAPPRGGRRGKPPPRYRGPALLGAARCPASAIRARDAAGRAGAGRARRQPHGPDVHRRPQRRLALRRAPHAGFANQPTSVAPRRRPAPARRLHHGHLRCAPPANKPTPAENDALPALPAGGAAAADRRSGSSSRSARSAGDAYLRARRAMGSARRARAALRPRRRRPRSPTASRSWRATTRASRTPSPAS